ncbi:MAG: phage tail sheath subtilisin-like domain-containing protein [Bacteroidales bacterium]|nr:phage tail sheath subtilisin-like domain-containing protein [Bacteroidales bacterium]
MDYKSPGVYVEEIETLPTSVAQVDTAIPAFIGYTQKAEKNGKPVNNQPVRVKNLLEYHQIFGGAPEPRTTNVQLNSDKSIRSVEVQPSLYMYDSIRMFDANNGGAFYVVSVGLYGDELDSKPNEEELKKGIDELEKFDEPTLIVIPDAVNLDAPLMADVQQHALLQCKKLGDRFAILDVKTSDVDNDINIAEFRKGVNEHIEYGAAYYPFIRTTLKNDYNIKNLKLTLNDTDSNLKDIVSDQEVVSELTQTNAFNTGILKLKFDYQDNKTSLSDFYKSIQLTQNKNELKNKGVTIKSVINKIIEISTVIDGLSEDIFKKEKLSNIISTYTDKSVGTILKPLSKLIAYDEFIVGSNTTLDIFTNEEKYEGFTIDDKIKPIYIKDDSVKDAVKKARTYFDSLFDEVITLLNALHNALKKHEVLLEQKLIETEPVYANIVKAVKDAGIVLPPSGAIAGVYASTDNNYGVWKAPANVSLNSVVGPTVELTNEEQELLNVDPTSGKSINAIRAFYGKGTLVWGGRTLDGLSNEWRYVNVRRFFNMVEESVKKSISWAVFEPNDSNTWVRVRGMVENYLTSLWRQGALTGAKTSQAFFVNVGLGTTMTEQDVLEGRMNIEIGLSVSRPGEFIILKFMHKMMEA